MRHIITFPRFAWGLVVYLLGVILWGAWVRITGSGAGCGAHWPTCHGEIIPHSPSTETLIELTHRLTSGICLPLVLVLLVWGFRRFPTGHGVRWASVGTLLFLLSEAAVGAGLVKFELVADNDSLARALTAAAHLINTFTLIGFAALVAWWGQHPQPASWNWRSRASLLLLPGLAAVLVVSLMGAITALGDTLFPTTIFAEEGLLARLQDDLSSSTHFLVQLRIVHPILAVLTGIYLIIVLPLVQDSLNLPDTERRGMIWVSALVAFQLLLGFVNVLLAAPGWMQLLHLLTAVSLWMALLLYWVWTQEWNPRPAPVSEPADLPS